MGKRDTETYKQMTLLHACEYIESSIDASADEILIAWQYIYDTGAQGWLQGWYGRTVEALLDDGLIEA